MISIKLIVSKFCSHVISQNWSSFIIQPVNAANENCRCNTCGEYVYKGKKFNSKKETVEDEDYLGIQIHRFYIRCPKCVAVIAFKV